MPSSNGRTDIMFVNPNHTETRIKKLNPNCEMSINILDGVAGTRETREIAPIDRASPKMRSESDSMRGLGHFMFSSKEGSQLVTIPSRKSFALLTITVDF